MYPISNVQIGHWFSKILSPNSQILAFQFKNYQLSNLNEILPLPYSKGADFKSNICFRKVQGQIPKFEHFGPKRIHFLILMKFCQVLNANMTLKKI